jgi:TolB protein
MKLLLLHIFISGCCLAATSQQYKIVYNVLEDREKDNYDVYSMNMDGSGKKNITNTPGVEWVYYAYRNKVYYVSDKDTCHRCYFLYEMDAEGNNKRKVSSLQLEDSWMGSRNKGTEMIVLGRIGKTVRHQLFLVNIQNGLYKQITNDTVSTKRDPIFLPGGKQVVLAGRPDKALRKTIPDELWKINVNKPENGVSFLGEIKQQLTQFPKSDTTTAWFEYHAGAPQYNSTYNFISYISRQNGQTQIFAVTPDGSEKWQLTADSLSCGWHSWSSNGKWLAMDKSTHEGRNFDIYLRNYKTKKEVQLTNSNKTEQAPVIVEIKKP